MRQNPHNRPLSPHLQIYAMHRFTSMTSVMHRATGIVSAFGMVFITCWLAAAASSESAYLAFNRFLSNPFIVLCLFIWTGCLCYHFCNGIRHLSWDIGKNLDIPNAWSTAKMVMIGGVVMNITLWIVLSLVA